MDPSLSPPELTCANAKLKAEALAERFPDRWVLAADTLVYLENLPLGKPGDMDEAFSMISRLQGRAHEVCTGVALIRRQTGSEVIFHEITQVTFKPLNQEEIWDYLSKIEPLDKAGGYAAQNYGSSIIAKTEGSWTNVVGLPMERVSAELFQIR